MSNRLYAITNYLVISLFFALMLGGSTPLPDVKIDQLSDYTQEIRYDFFSWVADASWIKLKQASLNSPHYIASAERKEIVVDYLNSMEEVLRAEWELEQIYTNPEIPDPETVSKELREGLELLYAEQRQIAPFAESVLEAQVSEALTEANLTTGGQPLPQPLYHISPLPTALIISPRESIYQDRSIMLLADFPVDKRDALEDKIFAELNFSALVVPVGGVGIYPTMGMRSTNLPWTLDTIAHEWTHNYLTWHPLGWNYDTTPELRTINETVASIVGGEISRMVLERHYPELLAAERPRVDLVALNEPEFGINFSSSQPPHSKGFSPYPVRQIRVEALTTKFFFDPDPFDFRAEMHETRLRVDELLSEGKIEEAEAYMEMRREYIWENGYAIRKLNQAYFAFYGAYADSPGGAAGTDPVGPAVRALREQSNSLADFVHIIMWVDSFEELQVMVNTAVK